jgi:hypothetical protein
MGGAPGSGEASREHWDTGGSSRLRAEAGATEQHEVRPARSRFRLLAPQDLVDHARGVTNRPRDPTGGSGIEPDASADYTARFKEMVERMRRDMDSSP